MSSGNGFSEREVAVATVLQVHDAARDFERETGVLMFEDAALGFIAALEAQDPPFTVSPFRPSLKERLHNLISGTPDDR